MGLISHKQIKAFRTYILSPRLELGLLLIYLVCFAMIVNLKINSKNGQSLGNPINLPAQNYKSFMEHQMLKDELYQIKDIDGIYAWIEKLQTERLWLEGGTRSPYWPIGSTRIVQQRIKKPEKCGKFVVPNIVPAAI